MRNVVTLVDPPRLVREPVAALSQEQARALLANGASVRYVADILGHSTPSQTMNVYARVTPTALRQTADLLDDVLASGA